MDRERLIEEITECVLARLSVSADTKNAISDIEELGKAIERLKKNFK